MRTETPQYLTLESASNPKTTLDEEYLRFYRAGENGPLKRILIQNHHVDQSYLRWANVGLDRYRDKKWMSPIQVILNRNRKLMHIVDPTNAHFYEDPEKFPTPENRIWMDIVEEYKAKMKYLFVCDCPSRKECTCYEGWGVDFFRCKEFNHEELDEMEYPERTMTDLLERNLGLTIILYYMKNSFKDEHLEFFMKQIEEGGKDKPEFWYQDEVDDINEFVEEARKGSKENRKKDEKGQGAPAPGSGSSSAGDENEASSSDKKESGGADTKVMCNLCGKTKRKSEIHRCGRCKKVYYCDKDCQKEDWKSHKGQCVPPPVNFTLPTGEKACMMPPMQWDGKEFTFIPASAQPKLQKKKKKE